MLRWIPPLAVLALVACGGSSTPETPEAEPAAPTSTLPAEGKRYDPAIDPSGVPAGAWMCDMGTVHYAAPHAGECPVCGMKLTEKR